MQVVSLFCFSGLLNEGSKWCSAALLRLDINIQPKYFTFLIILHYVTRGQSYMGPIFRDGPHCRTRNPGGEVGSGSNF